MTVFGIVSTVVALLLAAAILVVGYYAYVTWRISRRAEALVPPPGKFITINGNRIHYLERGQGRPIVFVHGLGGTQFHLSYPLFSRLEKDFHLIALDRPGSGYSTRAGAVPATPEDQATFIAGFIDELQLDRPLVVGHSLGGAISLALALDHANKISGLALIAPLTRYITTASPEFAPLNIPSPLLRWIVSRTISTPAAIRNGPKTIDFVFGPQMPPKDYAIAGGAMGGLRPSHFYASSTDFVAVPRTMERQETRYGELDMPVGVFFGDSDRVLNFNDNGLWLRDKIKGLDLEVLEGVGHMPHYSEGDRAEAFIRRMAGKAFAA